MDYNIAGQTVRIDSRVTEEARVNAAGITVLVTETGRLLDGLRFTVGSSQLVVDDAGVVTRSNFSVGNPVTAVTGSPGPDSVINNGTINGKIELGDGNDSYVATRESNGGIDMGAGDDLVRLIGQLSLGFGGLDGGPGDDRLELVKSSIPSSGFQFRNFETVVLDGAGEGGASGLRLTNLWALQGVRRLEIIGDRGQIDPFISSPQFYIRDTSQEALDIALAGYAALYLDNSNVGSVTGDDDRNVVILWNGSRLNGVDLGGGDDFLAYTLGSGASGVLSWPQSLIGGEGTDELLINFDAGGAISLDLGNASGFESIRLGAARNIAGSMLVTGLPDIDRLLIDGPISITLQNIVAPNMAIDFSSMQALTITAGSVVGRIGRELGTPGNNTPNPLVTWLVLNDGEIRGSVRLEEGDDRYDGRAGLVTGAVDGGAGNDELIGGNGSEDLRGGLGADRLIGNGGDDRLSGGAGGDTLLGGEGTDTAVFSGNRGDYEVSRSGSSIVVRDLRAGADGTDTLTDVERAEFKDGLMTLIPEELVLLLPGSRDLITWDSTLGANGFTYFFRLGATSSVAAVADFTGDGRADVLLSQPGGGLIRWDPILGGNGFAVLPAAPGFEVIGRGDLVGNVATDLLLRNAAGQLRILDPAAGTITNLFSLAAGWSVAGVGNINGSGKADVVLQNASSGAVIAFTDQGWRDLITLGVGWKIAGLGDVTGGLADDVILQRNDGVTIFWDATQGGNGWKDFATIGPAWSFAGFNDLNGDGRDDVVLQNTNGLAIYWTGSSWVDLGSTLVGTELVGTGLFP